MESGFQSVAEWGWILTSVRKRAAQVAVKPPYDAVWAKGFSVHASVQMSGARSVHDFSSDDGIPSFATGAQRGRDLG